MKVLNYGSLNIDHVYQVHQIVQPGQTIANAKAGCPVYHAGNISVDGQFLKKMLEDAGVDCTWLRTVDSRTVSMFPSDFDTR